jgi:uncharacterized protein (UPF0276 family)
MAHVPTARARTSVPASVGIGLRAPHYREILKKRPASAAWFEVHSENYFGRGGEPLFFLEKIRADYPVSLHGVGLSLGSTDVLDRSHLQQLKALIARIEPGLVSEHLSWSSFGGVFLNDLSPLPYTEEALGHLAWRIGRVQDFLGRRILIENPSSYLEYLDSVYAECEFLSELSRRTGCGILLDVNNLYVSCRNHGWNAQDYLRRIPPESVMEIHLAGHAVNRWAGREIAIDTHDRPVCEAVWDLYEAALRLVGPKPVLIEWDADLPPLAVLLREAAKAQALMGALYEQIA